MVESLADYGVDIRFTGQRPRPDEIKARIVAEGLGAGAALPAVALRYGFRANHPSVARQGFAPRDPARGMAGSGTQWQAGIAGCQG